MSDYPTAEEELKTMTRRFWEQVEITKKAQERIAALEKVAEEAEYMAKRIGATQAIVRTLRAAGYLKEQVE